MKLSKMLLIVLVLGFLVMPQLSYAGTFAVNLRGGAAETVEGQEDAAKAIDAAAAEKPETTPGEAPTKPTKLGSNETLLSQAKPALFNENMIGTISLPASELQSEDAVKKLADFILAGAEGKNVIVLGQTKEEVDSVRTSLAKVLKLEGIEGEKLFFAIVTNATIIDAVKKLFKENNGAFGLCTGNNLSQQVREDMKGAV